MMFQNRSHAGQLLAEKLSKFRNQNPVILALPRGGAPVAFEIAKELHQPWNVLVTRKIGAPFHSELAVGAMCEDDEPYYNHNLMAHMGLEADDLNRIVRSERFEIERQIQKFRKGQPLESFENRTVVLVDDGLATGATIMAALKYIQRKGAAYLVVAVPIAAFSSAEKIRHQIDELVACEESSQLSSVSQWYEDFSQVPDDDVLHLLEMTPETDHPFSKENFYGKESHGTWASHTKMDH